MNPEMEERQIRESRKILDVLRTYQSYRVPNGIFHSADFDVEFNQVRIMTEKNLVVDHLADDYYTDYLIVETPATTWQMFKKTHAESWWLGWLVRRRPVMHTMEEKILKVEVKRYLGYPDAVIDSTRLGRAIMWEQANGVWINDDETFD